MNRLEKLISILMRPFQRLENTAIQLLTLRYVDTATGYQLDVLGRVVGQARGGLVDDIYRRYIRARIATNRSTGRREELIRICRLILGDPAARVVVERQTIATVFIRIDNVALSAAIETALIRFMEQAVAAGVRVLVQTAPAIPTAMFKFTGGGLPTGPGFDSSVTPGSGGELSDMQD